MYFLEKNVVNSQKHASKVTFRRIESPYVFGGIFFFILGTHLEFGQKKQRIV